jgi:hypothetical protein
MEDNIFLLCDAVVLDILIVEDTQMANNGTVIEV